MIEFFHYFPWDRRSKVRYTEWFYERFVGEKRGETDLSSLYRRSTVLQIISAVGRPRYLLCFIGERQLVNSANAVSKFREFAEYNS